MDEPNHVVFTDWFWREDYERRFRAGRGITAMDDLIRQFLKVSLSRSHTYVMLTEDDYKKLKELAGIK